VVAEPLLETRGLTKRFGGVVATDGVSLAVQPGEIHAVIGPNDAGRIRFAGADVTGLPVHARSALGLARSFQVTSIFRDFPVLDNVALAVQAHAGHSFRLWRDARREAALRDPARAVLAEVGLAGRAGVLAADLAHGEQRQLEIAMALATRPRLLLLDEPTAGMGPEESRQMVALLSRLKGHQALVLVEHDMDAVFALADRITVLVYGRVIATGSPDEIVASPAVRDAYLGDWSAGRA
jgi:branched-chain amino acid transport system ATP-binding protein